MAQTAGGLDSTGVGEKVESSSAFGFGYFLTYHVQPWGVSSILASDISNGYVLVEGGDKDL
jgi:hypothetical protein